MGPTAQEIWSHEKGYKNRGDLTQEECSDRATGNVLVS